MANKDIKEIGKATHFNKDNQPPAHLKRKPKSKTLLKHIAAQIVTGGAVDDLKPLAIYLGVDPENIDIVTLMHLKQIGKAIHKGDTKAYQAVLDRLEGKPLQSLDHNIDLNEINILNNDPLSNAD